MRDLITSILDTLGLLLFAAGVGALAYQLIGWGALAVSGVVVIAGSVLSSHLSKSKGDGG